MSDKFILAYFDAIGDVLDAYRATHTPVSSD
jgi:hypothetical protein